MKKLIPSQQKFNILNKNLYINLILYYQLRFHLQSIEKITINNTKSLLIFHTYHLDHFLLSLYLVKQDKIDLLQIKYSSMGGVCCESCEKVIKNLRGEVLEIEGFVMFKNGKQPIQANEKGLQIQTDSLRVTYNSHQQEIDIRNTLLPPPSQDSGIEKYPSLNQSGRNWDPYVPSPSAMPQVQQQCVDRGHPFFMRNYGNEVMRPVVKKPTKKAQQCDDIKTLKRSSIELNRSSELTFNPIKSAI